MCGIAGFWGGHFNKEQAEDVLRSMGSAIEHRGPDDAGVWFDVNVGIGLSHRRLSIVDLSAAGHQPMRSRSSRYVMVFNGEVYNHLELRAMLEKAQGQELPWRGHSDTETLLAGFEHWGFEQTLRRTVGMFAIALWDRESRTLSLARDRMGEKPLYYAMAGGILYFGSELKALKAHPSFKPTIDRNALSLFLRHSYVPAPFSIYQDVRKLEPGSWIEFDRAVLGGNKQLHAQRYWSLHDAILRGRQSPFIGTDDEAVTELGSRLSTAVGLQQVADVPLGAFLSGGVDSSMIVALMQAQSMRKVKTYTIGFNEAAFNEADHAKAVARHLNTDHTELFVTAEQAREVIPRLPALYDEPFADSSQIPTFLVAGLARQQVTVSLSGDAGDELFGGYSRYTLARSIWRKMEMFSTSFRMALGNGLGSVPAPVIDATIGAFSLILPKRLRFSQPADKIHKLAEILGEPNQESIYRRLVSHWKQPEQLVIGATEPITYLSDRSLWPDVPDFEQWMMAMDTLTYLPDDILVKVDRAAMGVSLETRVPLLDHRVVEFAWQLPLHYKIRDGQGKWLLRQLLYRYVPQSLIERPKMGFGVPIDSWLRGPLRDWAEDLLSEECLRREGYFYPAPIRRKWKEHLSGRHNWQYYLWDILMFQAWHREQNQ
jgi:asparagine synthase (glutamine-hydrolysing)